MRVNLLRSVARRLELTETDWRRVAETLRRLHRLTKFWPQRPGWQSSTDLLDAETGTKVDLRAMPPEGVARCRAAWARFVGRPTCVVHGNPTNPGNVPRDRKSGRSDRLGRVARRRTDLDLALPRIAAGLDEGADMIPPRKRRPRGTPPSAGTTRMP